MANVGLFFYVKGELLWHKCAVKNGDANECFVNYPFSHMQIWDKFYIRKYRVDFDYYPRGRVLYRKADDTFLLYCDKCIPKEALAPVLQDIRENKYLLQYDEHYACRNCCHGYVTLG